MIMMGIYTIGIFMMFGYLETSDSSLPDDKKKFKGFKNRFWMVFMCLIWPYVVGVIISKALDVHNVGGG